MKKGFTLIELLVTLVLLSVIMVFMVNFIVNLRDKEDNLDMNINLMVNQAVISKELNTDIINNELTSVSCENDTKCTLAFTGGITKTLEILSGGESLKYYDASTVYFIKTLTGNESFERIEYTNSTVDTIKVITSDPEYSIEAYSY